MPPESPLESLRLRDATVADLDAILALDVASFKYPWSRASFNQALADRDRTLVILLERTDESKESKSGDLSHSDLSCRGTICGFGVAWSVADEGEIATLAVSQSERRQGLGEKIVCALTERLRARGVTQIFLEVRPSNLAARHLYEKLGFNEVGLRRKYYPDSEDAIVMKWEVEKCTKSGKL